MVDTAPSSARNLGIVLGEEEIVPYLGPLWLFADAGSILTCNLQSSMEERLSTPRRA
jgi:hypothetical protein